MRTGLEKLFTSPDGKGILASPFIFFLVGFGFMIAALHGAWSGEIDVGRYSSNVVRYASAPRAFVFAVASLLLLGAGCAWWGWRRLRLHDA